LKVKKNPEYEEMF